MDKVFPIIFVLVIVGTFATKVIQNQIRRRQLASTVVVNPGTEYPNNHHILGVGYYHAAAKQWFPQPWNEYREDRGYYWDGSWHSAPDQRLTLTSNPPPEEVSRVNQAWRDADPDRTRQFWNLVEHQGFGTAIRRSEGS